MGKYRLIGGGTRRSFISLEDKVKAIAEIYIRNVPPREAIAPLYEKASRELPKNTSIIVANWRKTIQDKLDAEDTQVVQLCKENGVIEEADAARKRRGR